MTAGRYRIHLERLSVQVRLGIHPDEVAAAQRVLVDVALDIEYGHAIADEIDEAVDYDYVRAGIVDLVAARHFNLQETLCEAIASLAFADDRVRRVTVRTTKPDIYPDAQIGCEIVRDAPTR